jgi:hypothetical protein
MAYKTFKALAVGTVGGVAGIAHFDPSREDEGGRYQKGIVPADVAAKAEKRGLIKITGDASEKDYQAQTIGVSARPADVAADRLEDMEKAPRKDAAGAAPATVASRNFPVGQGRTDTLGDPDAAPVDEEEPGPLDQSIDALTAHLATIEDVAELDRLRAAEVGGKSRKSAIKAIDARKAELAG